MARRVPDAAARPRSDLAEVVAERDRLQEQLDELAARLRELGDTSSGAVDAMAPRLARQLVPSSRRRPASEADAMSQSVDAERHGHAVDRAGSSDRRPGMRDCALELEDVASRSARRASVDRRHSLRAATALGAEPQPTAASACADAAPSLAGAAAPEPAAAENRSFAPDVVHRQVPAPVGGRRRARSRRRRAFAADPGRRIPVARQVRRRAEPRRRLRRSARSLHVEHDAASARRRARRPRPRQAPAFQVLSRRRRRRTAAEIVAAPPTEVAADRARRQRHAAARPQAAHCHQPGGIARAGQRLGPHGDRPPSAAPPRRVGDDQGRRLSRSPAACGVPDAHGAWRQTALGSGAAARHLLARRFRRPNSSALSGSA